MMSYVFCFIVLYCIIFDVLFCYRLHYQILYHEMLYYSVLHSIALRKIPVYILHHTAYYYLGVCKDILYI